ncbi:MAG: cobaltochelatase subunit CobN, partial [Bryobacterales bacterium]|nr:cobaltochelatase subunit CobN [Bryobacterales bacterium]
MTARLCLLTLSALGWTASLDKVGDASPVRALVITSHPESLRRALGLFEARYGTGRLWLALSNEQLDCELLRTAQVVFVEGGFWSEAMNACKPVAREMASRGTIFGGIMASLVSAHWDVPVSSALAEASRHLLVGGAENLVGFLVLLYNAVKGDNVLQKPPLEQRPESGIYHPEAGAPFASLAEYERWLAARGRGVGPRVGLQFFKLLLDHCKTAPVDAMIRALEQRGLTPVAAFGWPLSRVEDYFVRDGVPVVELVMLLDAVMPSLANTQFLEKYGLHAMHLITTSATEAEWRASRSGLPPGRLPVLIGNPERSGVTEPMLIATTEATPEGTRLVPLRGQIELAADRVAQWVRLRRTPNAEKRLALIYYNNPPGKATLGASYLDLIPSLRNVLARLREEGYRTGDELPDAEALKNMLLLTGRNVGEYAPGEVENLVREGRAVLLPVQRYQEWFRQLPDEFQRGVKRVWGEPERAQLMTVRRNGQLHFVIAGLRLGNLWLGPQPLRGELAEADARTHDRNTPPPHSYIAAYLWIRREFQAHALIHFGRHGTLEWLPGKDVALSESDPGTVLVGDLPHLYYYLVDGGGEHLQAKRRSAAVILSHMTPVLAEAGPASDYRELKSALENYQATRESSPTVADEHAHTAWDQARRLKLDQQLNLSESQPVAERMDRLAAYLHEVEEQAIPLGLHRIGEAIPESALREAVIAFLKNGATSQFRAEVLANAEVWAAAILEGNSERIAASEAGRKLIAEAAAWVAALRASPAAELSRLVQALEGRYVPSGPSGDPLRVSDALPTGRNLHDQDPRSFPTKAAWAAGERMARELIESYGRKHGAPPKRVSFVLWYGETGRTQGLLEAQALALLGVRPVWNGRGQVVDVELIPAAELGRPRVDVLLTVSGLYRDGMREKLALLDKAVRLVLEASEDNVVQAQTLEVENQLKALGVPPELAHRAARARLFGPAPGSFGASMTEIVESSRDATRSAEAARLYLRNMNYAYGAGLDGLEVAGALREHLRRNQVVVHARSSNLYGLIDNDETYQFAGGLNAATREASGRAPEFLIANARKAGGERLEEASGFLRRELATRLWNEKWIEGMKAAGYAGAQQIAREVEHLYGFQATAPEQVDGEVWQQTLDIYIKDKRQLGLARWFQQANPFAHQMLAARLIEIDRQGVYRFQEADRRLLVRAFIESVKQSGASCYANACGNRNLLRHVAALARELKAVPHADLRALQRI